MKDYKERIAKTIKLINEADYILIGAGAGLSTAAGLEYSGEKFEKEYKEYIEKYNFTDLYSASFYDFDSPEEKWAFWAKLIKQNRFNDEALKLYMEIKKLVKDKDYFVLTTNVDGQFENAGFDDNKIFAIQGDYAYLQCENGCHDKLYYNKKLVENWLKNEKNLKIPSKLVPKCPVCGCNMDMNLRKDGTFIQDEKWYNKAKIYEKFLNKSCCKKLLLIEFGVGFNTPGIIRIPFENMCYNNENTNLIRINKDYPNGSKEILDKMISFDEDTSKIIEDLLQ